MARALDALAQLVRTMGQMGRADEIFEPALSTLRDITSVERSSILLLEGGIARFKAWRGLSHAYRVAAEGHFPWPLDDPSPQPILFEDVQQEPSLLGLRELLRTEGIRAVAFIPLIYKESAVGKFMLYYDEPHAFTSEEVELAQAVAYLVAFAIERTRLSTSLEEADRRKDAFLATLAHELRNPLAPVSAALSLMGEHPDDLLAFHRVREVLERNVMQMVKLVDDLLDVSRITRGIIVLNKTRVDVTSVVHHAVAAVQQLIASQHQVVSLALEPLWLEADDLRLEQVVTNLVHNAAKYTPAHGHIWVETRGIDDIVEIRVRDDGIGIAPETMDNLFDLFVQADQSLARTRGGLGIGLTIVRKVVELHGGTVAVESKGQGRGAMFTVRMPGRALERAPLSPPAKPVHGARRRVLVVDDNDDAATMLSMLLEAWGHEVAEASTGPLAIEAVAKWHPDVVLLDLGLPGMTGYEVAERLRSSGERDLRIVAVSGYSQPEDVAQARAAGCDAHLSKPVDVEALERLLAPASS